MKIKFTIIAILDLALLVFLLIKGYIMFFFCLLGISLWLGVVMVIFAGMEDGFRQKFPFDFIMQIKWLIDYFEQKGFIMSDYENLGTENPVVVMNNPNGQRVIIRLNAPINQRYSIDINSLTDETTPVNWHFSDWNSKEKKKQIIEDLDKYFSTTLD